MTSSFPYSASAEDTSSLPYKLTFNNIPQGTKLIGVNLELLYSSNNFIQGNSHTTFTTIGNWRIPFSISNGSTVLIADHLTVMSPMSSVEALSATYIKGSFSGKSFELIPLPYAQPVFLYFNPGSLGYSPNSAVLIGVRD